MFVNSTFTHWAILLCCCWCSAPLFAQKNYRPTIPSNEELPAWASLMYAPNPNVWAVDSSYQAYYRLHTFQKSQHTQYYKRWRRAAAPYVDAQGYALLPTAQQRLAANEAHLQKMNHLRTLQASHKQMSSSWECLGPFETFAPAEEGQEAHSDQANIYCIDIAPSNANTLFCGTETGMIFKTTDKALNWVSVSHNLVLGGVTAVEIHPTNPNIVYAGDNTHLIKTTDGGANWTTVLPNVEVNNILVSTADPQIVLAATEQGLYRTTNGGTNWTPIYTQRSYDLEAKPNAPATIYLVKNNPTENRCEFFKSTNSGASFTIQSTGWFAGTDPNRQDGGARLTVTPADPNRVYAILIGQAKNGDNGYIGVYRSNDAGATWELPNSPPGSPYSLPDHPCLSTFHPDGSESYHQGFYNLGLAASHTDANVLYIGCLNFFRSNDGGASFEWLGGYGGTLPRIHPDIQELKIAGSDIWMSSDGGVNYSSDNMASHTARNNGLYASDYWGFGTGWNYDVLVGGRYHNGNAAYYESYPSGKYIALGGGEASTGYVNPGENRRVYHSDIGGTVLNNSYTGSLEWFGIQAFPNEAYYPAESSEMEFDSRCYNTWYMGKQNNLWRTTNGGASFEIIYAFGTNVDNQIKQIEVSRSNPDVIYLFQQLSSGANGRLWKTTNGGANWTQITLPAGDSRICAISLSATSENDLVVGFTYSSNGNKVFRTTNGGTNWSNLTTATLDNENINTVLQQGGSSGIYVGTGRTVYYRGSGMSDWVLYATGLPAAISTNQLRPFYKNNKIRMGSYGKGIWQADLYEPSVPVAQPMAERLLSTCPQDSIQFDDYSILDHNGATWQWQFEGGSPATSTLRNPRIAYSTPGTYDVTLTVTNLNGTSTKTIANMITIAPTATNAIPITENFEDASLNLTVSNPDGNITWALHTPTNCAAANGSNAYFLNCYNYGSSGQTDDLLFPENVSLVGVAGAWLKFRYAYAPYTDAGGTYTDSLRVMISNNCGRDFVRLFDEGGENLSTTTTGSGPNNNYESSDWYPESCNDWQEACINLTPYAGQVLQIKFQSRNGYGNNIFLDNIVLEQNALLAPAIAGTNMVCSGQTQSYSAPAGGSSYTWVVSGGTIVLGQGTNNVTIQWASSGAGSLSLNIVP